MQNLKNVNPADHVEQEVPQEVLYDKSFDEREGLKLI
jgi:hypothetical protein